jgi:hypothetical protein
LFGLKSGRCPECGTEFRRDDFDTFLRIRTAPNAFDKFYLGVVCLSWITAILGLILSWPRRTGFWLFLIGAMTCFEVSILILLNWRVARAKARQVLAWALILAIALWLPVLGLVIFTAL